MTMLIVGHIEMDLRAMFPDWAMFMMAARSG